MPQISLKRVDFAQNDNRLEKNAHLVQTGSSSSPPPPPRTWGLLPNILTRTLENFKPSSKTAAVFHHAPYFRQITGLVVTAEHTT